MRITDVKTVLLTGPSTNDPYLRECRKWRSAAFIEIHTDTELMGLGETYAGYYCPELVPPVVEFFKDILIGQSVDNIAELWQRMHHCHNFWCRVGVGVVILNGIEAALWDLKGKMHGLPVYELLGGVQARIDRRLRHRWPQQLSAPEAGGQNRSLLVAWLPGLQARRGRLLQSGSFRTADKRTGCGRSGRGQDGLRPQPRW